MTSIGELADNLTEIIEELERASYAQDTKLLCGALQRAFLRACELDRLLRKRNEAGSDLDVQVSVAA